MIYSVELRPETAKIIEAKAAEKGLTPEDFLASLAERSVQSNVIPDEQFRKSMEFSFEKYAPAFEVLARSEREDAQRAQEDA